MKILNIALISAVGLVLPVVAYAQCPAAGVATGCNLVVTFNPDGSETTTVGVSPGTYDGSDDTLIGVVNNSAAPISSFNLSSSLDIFGFDGDGIDTFLAITPDPSDDTGYGGPDAFFTNIVIAATETGTVNFTTPIPTGGGSTYFSLEEAIDINSAPVVTSGGGGVTPEPDSLILLGTGALGLVGIVRRKMKA
jgi:hypothetical protein